jgi:hypothetical protein
VGYQLEAETDAGRDFVARCESHIPDFEARADAHDRAGTFPSENFEELQASGVMAAAVPEELGGLGVASIRDLLVLAGRAVGKPVVLVVVEPDPADRELFTPLFDAAKAEFIQLPGNPFSQVPGREGPADAKLAKADRIVQNSHDRCKLLSEILRPPEVHCLPAAGKFFPVCCHCCGDVIALPKGGSITAAERSRTG